MSIKYAKSVNVGKKKNEGKNYSGASWDGNNGLKPNRMMNPRQSLRAAGQTKGKTNPLLGACKSRSGKTGAIMRRPFSTHSSNPDIRAFARFVLAQQEANNNGESS